LLLSGFSSVKDALLQHIKRTIYQAGIWATSDDHQQNIPSPDRFSWKKEDGCWVPVWLTFPEVSRSSRKLVKCSLVKLNVQGVNVQRRACPALISANANVANDYFVMYITTVSSFPTVEMEQLLGFFVLHHREIVRHVCLLYSYYEIQIVLFDSIHN